MAAAGAMMGGGGGAGGGGGGGQKPGGIPPALDFQKIMEKFVNDIIGALLPIQKAADGFLKVFDPISDLFEAIGEIIGTGVQPLVTWLVENLVDFIPVAEQIADVITEFLNVLMGKEGAVDALSSALDALFATLGPLVLNFFDSVLPGIVTTLITYLPQAFDEILEAMKGLDWAALAGSILELLVGGLKALFRLRHPLLAALLFGGSNTDHGMFTFDPMYGPGS